MKIAIIAEHVHRHGGQERVVAELIARLALRHDIDLFCFSASDIPAQNVTMHRLWCPERSSTLQAIWLVIASRFVIRPRRYDVILSQGGNSLVQNFVLVHTCHARRTQASREVRWRYHKTSAATQVLLRLRRAWATWMEGRAVRRCRGRVIAVSTILGDYLITQHGLQPGDVHIAPNGVDHSTFNRGRVNEFRPETRRQLGLEMDDFVVLFVGGLWFDKGLPLLIEALGLMATKQAHLIVIGKGDNELFTKIAAEHGVAGRVTFLPSTDQIVRYYAAADCLAFPSESEGFGLVMAEAGACGLPLVVTPVGAAQELVEDGVSGFLINYEPALIAAKLDVLAADPQLRRQMGEAAHDKSLKLSWDRQAEEIERIFLSQLPQPAAKKAAERRGIRARAHTGAAVVKVAAISHSCVVDTNQQLYVKLIQYDDVALRLITPQRWRSSLSGPITTRIVPELEDAAETLPVWWPGQIHLHRYGGQLRRTLAAFAPDIVFVDEEPYSVAAAQGAYWAGRLNCKLIVASKENLVRRYPPPLRWTYRWVLRQADHILVVSEECEKVLRQRRYQGGVTVLPHGIDPQAFSPDWEARQRQRERLGLTGAVVGYIGRLTAQKGVMDLVKAVRIASEDSNVNLSLLLIGEGKLRHQLAQVAREFVAPNKLLVTGPVPHQQVPQFINALDILVLPSRTTARWKEQFGRVLIEALACEVPVIGSDSGHIPQLINDTGGGLVFREGHAAELAARIRQLLEEPSKAQSLAQRGRQRVLEKYTWSQTAAQLHEVLQQVASGQIL